MEELAADLNGYLQAIRRLTFNQISPSAHTIAYTGDVELDLKSFINETSPDATGISISRTDGTGVTNFISNKIVARAAVSDEVKSLLDWDIGEYFGLISTSLGSEVFHPHLEGGVLAEYYDPAGNFDIHCLGVIVEAQVIVILIGEST